MTDQIATNPVAGDDSPAPGVDDAIAADIDTSNTEETGAEDGQLVEGDEGYEPPAVDEGDELVEIDREGKKYKIPKSLHGEMLMQADYTRKTQALAETAKTLEQGQQALVQQRVAVEAAIQQDRVELGKVFSLQTQLDAWKDVDWDAIEKHDRENGTNEMSSAMRRHLALKDALAEAEGGLRAKLDQRTAERTLEETRHAHAERLEDVKLIQDGFNAMKRDFPDWSPQVGQKTMDFGVQSGGFTAEELNQVRDPRMIKILHLARLGQEAMNKNRAAANVSRAQLTTPAPTLTGNAALPKGEPKDPAEWAKWRNAQVAERRKAGRRR
jgi:hypothetical protein